MPNDAIMNGSSTVPEHKRRSKEKKRLDCQSWWHALYKPPEKKKIKSQTKTIIKQVELYCKAPEKKDSNPKRKRS